MGLTAPGAGGSGQFRRNWRRFSPALTVDIAETDTQLGEHVQGVGVVPTDVPDFEDQRIRPKAAKDGRGRGRPVKRRVDLDGVEELRQVGRVMETLRRVRWIDNPLPILV